MQCIPGHSSLPGNDLADSLAKVETSLLISPKYQYPFHPLFPHKDYLSTPVGDAVSNLASFNIKSLQYLPRSLLSLAPLAVLSPVYAATGTALSLTLISTGLVEPRLLHAATVVLNHRHFSSRARLPCTGPSASGHIRPFPLYSGPLVPSVGNHRLLGLREVDPRPHPQEWVR